MRPLPFLSLLAALCALPLYGEVQIERIYMPLEASPSSFAIGLPQGVSFCFDPIRGGVNYVWTGGFVDIGVTRPGTGKFISPVKLLGPVVYQETGTSPLRRGDPAHVPVIEFTGYTLRNDSVEFRYTVDGVAIREDIRVRPDGSALIRHLHPETGADAKWWHVVAGQPASELKRESNGSLVIEVPLKKATP